MNRNQKIALGCGGAGCLGLILAVILGVVLIVSGVIRAPGLYNPDRNSNYNVNSNRNSNYNSPSNDNSSSSSASMSDDDKHKLVQAAGMTNDSEVMQRVLRKLGFITSAGVGEGYQQFLRDHPSWATKNVQFIRSINTPEKARAYVDAHIND